MDDNTLYSPSPCHTMDDNTLCSVPCHCMPTLQMLVPACRGVTYNAVLLHFVQSEIELILNIGVPAEKIIYANPCKYCSYMRYAAEVGVDVHSFDSEGELRKTKKYFSHSKQV